MALHAILPQRKLFYNVDFSFFSLFAFFGLLYVGLNIIGGSESLTVRPKPLNPDSKINVPDAIDDDKERRKPIYAAVLTIAVLLFIFMVRRMVRAYQFSQWMAQVKAGGDHVVPKRLGVFSQGWRRLCRRRQERDYMELEELL